MYNPFTLKGKTILVTGASSGIGMATAIECSRMGATLVITGRNEKRLRETFDLLEGENHTMVVADLNGGGGIDALLGELPSLHGMVHCAGLTKFLPFQFV